MEVRSTTPATARAVHTTFKLVYERTGDKPHWRVKDRDGKPVLFANPWLSFSKEAASIRSVLSIVAAMYSPHLPDPRKGHNIAKEMPKDKSRFIGLSEDEQKCLKATWLGHASYLIELPTPPGAQRGARLLFDPICSERCSPSQWIGPKRYTPAPLQVDELPDVDIVLISHDHYDHMDADTLVQLEQKFKPHFVAGLNNEKSLSRWVEESGRIHCHDWWDRLEVTVPLPRLDTECQPGSIECTFDLHITPCQHQSNRSAFDRNTTLWCGFALTNKYPGQASNSETSSPATRGMRPFSFYFAGDTGYRYVPLDDEPPEDELKKYEFCPAFKEIGNICGGFDLALLPIGAYQPYRFMSNVHSSPADAVRIFKDCGARFALAMHWGTFVLTNEDIMQPVKDLTAAKSRLGIRDDSFIACRLGKTTFVDCPD